MSRPVLRAGVALLGASGALVLGSATPGVAAPARDAVATSAASTAVGVDLDEFTLSVFRKRAPQGTVRFNVTNRGEDPHDLVVIDSKGRRRGSAGVLQPTERRTLRVTLRARGIYRLVCTLADHEKRGMLARVRITKAPKKKSKSKSSR